MMGWCALAGALLSMALGLASGAACAAPVPQHIVAAEMVSLPSPSFGPIEDRIDEKSLPGSWQPVALPHSFFDLPLPGARSSASRSPIRTTWYRVHLDEHQAASSTTHFYMLRWQVAGQIALYGDGRLLYRSRGTPLWNIFRHPPLFIPLNHTPSAPVPRTLLIRVDSLSGTNGAISSFWVGDSDALYQRYSLREWLEYQLPFMSSAAFLAVGLFSLAVWLLRKREPIYLLFFFAALCTVTRRFHFHAGLEQLPMPDAWFGWLTVNTLVWQVVALHFFFGLLHGQRQAHSSRVLLLLAGVSTVFTLPVPLFAPSMVHVRPYIFFILILLTTAVVATGWIRSARARSREGVLLAAAYAFGLAAGIYDYIKQTTTMIPMESFYATPYAAMGLFLVYAYVMFRRYTGAIGAVEQLNASLEARLQAREAELNQSHARLREIEQRETLSQERQRLMQDMHDGLGSSLMSALRVIEHGRVDEEAIKEVLKGCMDDLKLTIDSMEPVEADLLLLLATLRFRLAPRLENSGITLRWEVVDVPALTWLDPRSALHILRILQEAFTNVIKHTQAREIRVTTGTAERGVWVAITDNGPGFDVSRALACGGKGMANQMRRAQAVGGRVEWLSDAQGTRFVLWLPLRAPAGGETCCVPQAASSPA